MKTLISILLLAVIGALPGFAQTQKVQVQKNAQWEHDFTIYLFAAAMNGTTGIGNAEVEVDQSFSDIVENLKFGAMANYRGVKDRFTVGVDMIFMDLGADVGPVGGVEFEQWMVEGNVGWKLTDMVELLAGVRFNDLSGSVTPNEVPPQTQSGAEYWFDPIVGARLWIPIAGSFSALVRGDIGGFGVGSELTWQLGGYFIYKTSGSLSWLAGYRYLYVDYESGQGASTFLYDMAIQGPAVGLSWEF